MWPYQKKLWEWGSEMTVDSIKESKETGKNNPSREYQLERIFHLLSNQLSPGYEIKRLEDYASPWKNVVIFAIIGILVIPIIIEIKRYIKRKEKPSAIDYPTQ